MSRESSNRKLENTHEAEIKERWGGTPVYEEYKAKTKDYSPGKWAASNLFMMVVFEEFSECMKAGRTSGSEEAQRLVAKLQETITSFYYTCTDEILAGLGKMYVADERFKKNIDKKCEGTAAFVADAIEIYCRGKGI